MSAIAQRHEWQQRPIVIGGGVTALVDAKPPLNLGASRVVEVDDADEGDEAGSPSRACTVHRRNRGGHGVGEKGRGGDGFSGFSRLATQAWIRASPRESVKRSSSCVVIRLLPCTFRERCQLKPAGSNRGLLLSLSPPR